MQQQAAQSETSAGEARKSDPGLLFQPGEVGDYLGFATGAFGRHWLLCTGIVGAFVVASLIALTAMPRKYHVEAHLLVHPSENAPGTVRSYTGDGGGLSQSAAEVAITQQARLTDVRELNLVQTYEQHRTWASRLMQRLRATLSGQPTEADREAALVGMLGTALTIEPHGQEVVISADWNDPQTAFALVERAQKRLLDARKDAEFTALTERVKVLDAQVKDADAQLGTTVADISKALQAVKKGSKASTVRGMQADGKFGALPDPTLAQLRMELVAKRKQIAELEDVRQKRLADLNAKYAEQKITYAEGHPMLAELRAQISALSQPSHDTVSLRDQEQQLLSQFVAAGGKDNELVTDSGPVWPVELQEENVDATYGKARLSMQLSGLQSLRAQLTDARLQLAAAEASFAARYQVLTAPEVPRTASSRPLVIALAAMLGSLLVAAFAAMGTDLRRGKVLEAWQLQRSLELPVLSEMPEP